MLDNILGNRRLLIIVGVVITIIAIIVALVLFRQKPQQIVVDNTPVKLVWWKPFYGEDTYREIIEGFKQLPGNENVTIEMVRPEYGESYYRNLIADIARNNGPDIFSLRNDDLPAYKEFITPISNVQDEQGFFIPDSKLLADYRTNFVDLVAKNTIDRGQIYGITSYVENLQLYYNKNLLAQAGIAQPAKSWTELDRQLNILNQRDLSGINFLQSAISLGTGLTGADQNMTKDININRFQDIIAAILFQAGGDMYDYRSGKVVFGNDKNEQDLNTQNITDQNLEPSIDEETPTFQAINFYNSFANINSSRYSWNGESINNIEAFAQGKLAYLISYSYLQSDLAVRNNKLNYEVSPLPQLDQENKRTYGFFFMDSINRKLAQDTARNPNDRALKRKYQVAKNFMYYLSTKDVQQKFVSKTSTPAAHRSVIDNQLFGDRRIRVFAEGSLYSDNYYKPDIDEVEKIWGKLFYRIQYENVPIEESIRLAVEEYKQLVSAGPKIR